MTNSVKRIVISNQAPTGLARVASLLGALRRAQPTAEIVIVDGVRRLRDEPQHVQVETKPKVNALGFTDEEMAAQKAKGDAAAERQRKKIARQAKGMKS